MIRNGVRSRSRTSGAVEATDTSAVPAERVTNAGAVASDTGIDATLMRQLAQLISESDLAELEVEKGDLRIRLVRYSPAPTALAQGAAPQMAAPIPAAVVVAAPVLSPSDADHPGAVKSPMVGTAYRRASPDSKAFVEIGSIVKTGEKLMLVEAMKTFNEILAPKAGTVTAIFIDDGQPVEYGQPLLVIE
jgi:acetyl-CoA carboxylase biotin carboxyl carrier protein